MPANSAPDDVVNINDETPDEVTLVANDPRGDNVRVNLSGEIPTELGELINGMNIDFRNANDDLTRVLEEIFRGDGIIGVDVSISDDLQTVILCIGEDTINLTGDFVSQFINDVGGTNFIITNNGVITDKDLTSFDL